MSRPKLVFLWLLSAFFVFGGVAHFLRPTFYVALVPPVLPFPEAVVAISGVIEIALGLAVLVPRLRRWAAWGLVALLIAVFPSNIYAAIAGIEGAGGFARLPLQAVFLAWAWWYTRPEAGAGGIGRAE